MPILLDYYFILPSRIGHSDTVSTKAVHQVLAHYGSHRFALFGVLGLALFGGDVAALLLVVAVLLRHLLALALVLRVALQVVRALLRKGVVSCNAARRFEAWFGLLCFYLIFYPTTNLVSNPSHNVSPLGGN